jgi:hypothetical protein
MSALGAEILRVEILGAGSIGNHRSQAARRLGWSIDLCDTRLTEQRTTMGQRRGAPEVEGEHVSIDTEWNIARVDWLLARRAAGERA